MSATLQPAESPSFDVISKRRASTEIVLLSDRLDIAFAHPSAILLLSRMLRIPPEYLDRLPLPVELQVRDALRRLDPGKDILLEPVPSLLLRVSRLLGRGGKGVIALQIEERRVRNSAERAANRYGLTKRESELLCLVVRGKSGDEIAAEMCIAVTTVSDYIKRLLRKTCSKNRAEMLARIYEHAQQ